MPDGFLGLDDIVIRLLVWLSVPAFFVNLVALILWALDWLGTFRRAGKIARAGVDRLSFTYTGNRKTEFLAFLGAQTLLLAWVYLMLQAVVFFQAKPESSAATGSVSQIFRNAIAYTPHASPVAIWGTGVVAGATVLSLVSQMFGLDWLGGPPALVYVALCFIGALIAVLNVILGIMVLAVSEIRHLAPVYGAWLVGGLVLALLSGLSIAVADLEPIKNDRERHS